ncbi:MAG: copper resistance CopC family protein [Chloroflexota bacterium]|nr:copper resistance protein CopC [Chloroflexota bacterium]
MSKRVKSNLLPLPLIGGLVVSLIFILIQSSLLAQATLVNATPTDNQIFKKNNLPEKVTLTFSEGLKSEGSLLRVIDTLRSQVDRGTITVSEKQISVELNKGEGLPPTDYSVEYSVVSAVDGSITNGSYNFRIVPLPGNPLDVSYQFSTPTSPFGNDWGIYFPLALVYSILFLIGAIGSNFVYFYGKYRFKENRLTYTMLNRASRNAAIVFSLGVFFFLCRLGNLQPFNARIWLYLTIVLLIFYTVRGVTWRMKAYPLAKTQWLEYQQKHRKKNPEPVIANASPAKVAAKSGSIGTLSSGSADAGGEEKLGNTTLNEGVAARPTETPRGLSARGQKRREKKRDKR